MQKVFFLFVTTCVFVFSCTRKNESSKPVMKLMTHKEAVDTLRALTQKSDDIKQKMKALIVVKEEENTIWEKLDLASTLCEPGDDNAQYGKRFDGFYGKDNYRIEMYFAKVTKDPKRSNVYLVEGKSRFKNSITPFVGEISFAKATRMKDPNMTDLGNVIDDESEMQTNEFQSLEGTFSLKEDSLSKGSGIFEGKIYMDLFTKKDGENNLWFYSPETLAQGSGFKFEGNWISYKTGTQKHVVFAKDIFHFADNILKNFSIGEREVEINPKYRHLGWDKYWENDEWWNEAIL